MSIGHTGDDAGTAGTVARNCPCCGRSSADARRTSYGTAEWPLLQCTDCAMLFVPQYLPYTALERDHAWEVSSKEEDKRRAEARPLSYKASKATRRRLSLFKRRAVLEDLQRHVTAGDVIDLGCGGGSLVAALPDGFVPHGIEISEQLAEEARDRLGARGGMVFQGPCLDGLKKLDDGFLKGAILRSYLEHEAQPLEVLRELHRTIATGGVAIVKVPNYATVNRLVMGRRWCGFRFPDHLNQFTPATLRDMAVRAGFEPVMRLRDRLPTSDNMYAVLIRREQDARQTAA